MNLIAPIFSAIRGGSAYDNLSALVNPNAGAANVISDIITGDNKSGIQNVPSAKSVLEDTSSKLDLTDDDGFYTALSKAANSEMDFNAKQAQLQRDWQEYMSNTAYSRAIADLRRNGINPYAVLSGLNGSSTPSGSSASYSGYASAETSAMANLGSSITGSIIRSLTAIAISAPPKGGKI